jgi:16S rRNA (uracil1498-N3)-methyltransferase
VTVPRLFAPERLETGREVRLDQARAHYLGHVLRLRAGARLRLFNPDDGEWEAELGAPGRQGATATLGARVREPAAEPGPALHFAPIRRNRLDWLVEKAAELGAARLVPLLTERTVVRLENPARLRAVAAEAAEQCGRLSVPEIANPVPLGSWLAGRSADRGRPLLLADEAGGEPIATALAEVAGTAEPPDLMVGPEGGWAPRERALLLSRPGVRPVSLGPLILRAETAALAALAAWQAVRGAGRVSPGPGVAGQGADAAAAHATQASAGAARSSGSTADAASGGANT